MKTINPLVILGILVLLGLVAVSLGCGQGDQVEASTDDTRGNTQAVAETAARLNKWEFMVTGAPIRATGGTGALLNLTATF